MRRIWAIVIVALKRIGAQPGLALATLFGLVVVVAPCQWKTPGGVQTTSPARISRLGPPRSCTQPSKSVPKNACGAANSVMRSGRWSQPVLRS